MISIRKIEESTAKLYGPDDVLIGEITSELQLYDVRCQINDQKLDGYYLIWRHPVHQNNWKLFIDKDGRISDWPNDFFDKSHDYLRRLVNWDKV